MKHTPISSKKSNSCNVCSMIFSDPKMHTQSQLYQNNLSSRTNQPGQKTTHSLRKTQTIELWKTALKKGLKVISALMYEKTPQVGLEPTTYRLTAGCSAIELLRIISLRNLNQLGLMYLL